MTALKIFTALIFIFILQPCWWYLWYRVLTLVNATSEMWLLYWFYVPMSFLLAMMAKIAELAEGK